MELGQIVDEAQLDLLLAAVDAVRLTRDVEAIARFVRLPGTPDESEVFACLEARLASFGLRTRLFSRPGYVSLPRAATLAANGVAIDCAAHSMTASVKNLEAALVYCTAEQIAAAESDSLRGKCVLTDGLAMFSTVEAAARRGAAAVVFITGAYIHEMIVSSVWGSPTPRDLDSYPTIPAVSVSAADGERLKEQIWARRTAIRLTTRVENFWTELPILTADLPGYGDDYLLVSGHVDSWHHGALDNASGNAAMLEIARILSRIKSDRDGLRRGVKFVSWSGHSHGRYAGSAAFCDDAFTDLSEHCFLHVNIDCLGGRGATLLTQSACMSETKALGAAVLKKVTGETLEGVRFSRSCDQSFWGTGTPSLFSGVSEQPPKARAEGDAAARAFAQLFGGGNSGGFGWWWHTVADTPDKLDARYLARDCRIYLAAIYTACAAPFLPFQIEEAAREVLEALRKYAKRAEPWIDFAPLVADAQALLQHTIAIEEKKQAGALCAETYSRYVLAIERQLVPLLYVKDSRFGHDAARRQPPLPLLEECRDLESTRDPHRRAALITLLTRRRNEVRCAVRAAKATAQALLEPFAISPTTRKELTS